MRVTLKEAVAGAAEVVDFRRQVRLRMRIEFSGAIFRYLSGKYWKIGLKK